MDDREFVHMYLARDKYNSHNANSITQGKILKILRQLEKAVVAVINGSYYRD